jgi:hypothetical protein
VVEVAGRNIFFSFTVGRCRMMQKGKNPTEINKKSIFEVKNTKVAKILKALEYTIANTHSRGS